jgi:hypothetical protein
MLRWSKATDAIFGSAGGLVTHLVLHPRPVSVIGDGAFWLVEPRRFELLTTCLQSKSNVRLSWAKMRFCP